MWIPLMSRFSWKDGPTTYVLNQGRFHVIAIILKDVIQLHWLVFLFEVHTIFFKLCLLIAILLVIFCHHFVDFLLFNEIQSLKNFPHSKSPSYWLAIFFFHCYIWFYPSEYVFIDYWLVLYFQPLSKADISVVEWFLITKPHDTLHTECRVRWSFISRSQTIQLLINQHLTMNES